MSVSFPSFSPSHNFAVNINHQALLEPIQQFILKRLQIPDRMEVLHTHQESLHLRLIPWQINYEKLNKEGTSVYLVPGEPSLPEILSQLSVPEERVFSFLTKLQFWQMLSLEGPLIYRYFDKKEKKSVLLELQEHQFQKQGEFTFNVLPRNLVLHTLSYSVRNIAINFFWVEGKEELGEQNNKKINKKIEDMFETIYQYNDLEFLGLHLEGVQQLIID